MHILKTYPFWVIYISKKKMYQNIYSIKCFVVLKFNSVEISSWKPFGIRKAKGLMHASLTSFLHTF